MASQKLSGRAPQAPAPIPAARGPLAPATGRLAALRAALDRPLTAYYLLIGGTGLLLVLGLVMVFSASQIQALQDGLSVLYYFKKQLVAAVLGLIALTVAARLPPRVWRRLAYVMLFGTIVLLLAVLVPGVGKSVNGNQNWIPIGPLQVQPSEFAKIALIVWGADLLTRKGQLKLLTEWKHLLVPLLPGAMILLGLIMLEGDMGTTMVLVAVFFALLWLAGAPARLFAVLLTAAGAAVALFIAVAPHRLGRLDCVGSLSTSAAGQCYQAVHGLAALSSGGFFGSGLGSSVQKWGSLPEPHTDFIFAVTGEELGLAGTLSVLVLFAALGYAGIRVADRTKEPFIRLAAGGITVWIIAQAVVNIGSVLGLLPIAGVPLPLVSYGGSALLSTLFALGMLIGFARSEPEAIKALAKRGPGRMSRLLRKQVREAGPGRAPAGRKR